MAFATVHSADPRLYQGGLAVVALATAMLIGGAVHPANHLSRWVLDRRPMRWLGSRSYAAYLWHWPVIVMTRPNLDVPLDGMALLGLQVGLTLLAAEASFRWVEAPIRRGAIGRAWHAWREAPGMGRRGAIVVRGRLASLAAVVALSVSGLLVTVAAADPPARPSYLPVDEIQGVLIGTMPETGRPTGDPTDPTDPTDPPPPSAEPTAPAATEGPTPRPARSPATDQSPSHSTPRPKPARDDPTPLPRPTPTPAPPEPDVLAIGDSVLIDTAPALAAELGRVEVDARIGRHVDEGVRLLEKRQRAGTLPDIVIIGLGTNGPLYKDQFERAMAALAEVPTVLWVSVTVPRSWEDHTNLVLRELVPRYPNARLVDWHALSADRPDLFWRDGYHPAPPAPSSTRSWWRRPSANRRPQAPSSAWRRSAMRSSAASTPTDSRISAWSTSSADPATDRWVMTAGTSISDSTPPRDSASVNSRVVSQTANARSRAVAPRSPAARTTPSRRHRPSGVPRARPAGGRGGRPRGPGSGRSRRRRARPGSGQRRPRSKRAVGCAGGGFAARAGPGSSRAGPGTRAHRVLEEPESLRDAVVAGDRDPVDGVRVAGQVLRRRVEDDVRAEPERLLQRRRRERVVDDDQRPIPPRLGGPFTDRAGRGGDVDESEMRVRGRFEPDEPRPLGQCLPEDVRPTVEVDVSGVHARRAVDPLEVAERAAVDVVADDDLFAARRQLGDGRGRRRAARERDPVPATLERGDRSLEPLARRVLGAAVFVPTARPPDAVLGIGRGLVDRRGDGAGQLVRLGAGMDGDRVEVKVAGVEVVGHRPDDPTAGDCSAARPCRNE